MNDRVEKNLGEQSAGTWDRPGARRCTPRRTTHPWFPLGSSIKAIERETQRVWPTERLAPSLGNVLGDG